LISALMKIPILSSMPKALLIAFLIMFAIGAVIFGISFFTGESGHEGYWTAFALHGVAEFWGFTLAGLVTFVVAVKLGEEKIKPILKFVATLRETNVIEKETARGIVMCAAKIIAEEKITNDFGTSIAPQSLDCDICALEIRDTEDKRCQFCGIKNHIWQISKKSEEP
jgi:hypothetical protein